MSHVQHLESIPFQPLDQMTTPNRYVFTTGGDPDLVHKRKIDRGAVGEVHEVRFLIVTITSSTDVRSFIKFPPAR